jgi:hypothetical protein
MPHLLKRLEERLHGREERAKCGTPANSLLVTLREVSLDPHHVSLGILVSMRHLPIKAVGGLPEDCRGLGIPLRERRVPVLTNLIPTGLNDHRSSRYSVNGGSRGVSTAASFTGITSALPGSRRSLPRSPINRRQTRYGGASMTAA